jgi:hypothetical protein
VQAPEAPPSPIPVPAQRLRSLSDDSLSVYIRAVHREASPRQLFECLRKASRLRRDRRLCRAAHLAMKQALLAGHLEAVEGILQVFGGSTPLPGVSV